jgi:MFS family permease
MTTQFATGQDLPSPAIPQAAWTQQGFITSLRDLFTQDLSGLLLSTALFEITGNIVYVMLMERTFDLGGPTGVGVFLVLQAGTQLLLGSLVGSFADNLGARRSEIYGLFALASFALGLAYATSIGVVYLLALHITIARLFVITSRLPLLSELSARSSYLNANTAISALEGLGLFAGPAIGAALALAWHNLTAPFIVSSVLFLLSAVPLLVRPNYQLRRKPMLPLSMLEEVREGWRHIVRHRPIWEVLACLAISSLAFGAIMPMLTLLAKRVGLGIEGSGVFVAAIGLGWMLGPISAGQLARRLTYTRALLVTGLATPLAALAIGFLPSVGAILVALAIAAIGGASLRVIVITVIQRLTPKDRQGSIMGTQQALAALVWILSAVIVTLVLAITPSDADPRWLFYPTGVLGALAVVACWSFGRRTLQVLVDGVATRIG